MTATSSGVKVGVICPKCGKSPTQSFTKGAIPDPLMFYCIDCDHHWPATPDERARVIALASRLRRP